jgi:His-Xaa-Ser repeat protein HxsA
MSGKRNWGDFLKRVMAWAPPTVAAVTSAWTPAKAAGSTAAQPWAGIPMSRREPITFVIPNRVEGPEIYVGHRSHRSRSSHRSHYSSSGGGSYSAPSYSPPAIYTPPASSPTPSYPSTVTTPSYPSPSSTVRSAMPSAPQLNTSPSTQPPAQRQAVPQDQAIVMAMRVQLNLKQRGYYNGPIEATSVRAPGRPCVHSNVTRACPRPE